MLNHRIESSSICAKPFENMLRITSNPFAYQKNEEQNKKSPPFAYQKNEEEKNVFSYGNAYRF